LKEKISSIFETIPTNIIIMNLEMTQTSEDTRLAREEAKRDMKMYMANDWQLKEETPE
jgi:hypothetical protein